MPTKKVFAPNWAVHPGEILAEHMEMKGMTQAELARRAGLTRKLVSEIVAGKNPVTARTAVALGPVLGLTPVTWLILQADYDIYVAEREATRDKRRRA